jgi:uncharacterized membrane protein YbhN (UPF0104 family)
MAAPEPSLAAGAGDIEHRSLAHRIHLRRIVVTVAVLLVVGGVCSLLGWDVRAALSSMWDSIRNVGIGFLIAACAAKTIESLCNGYAYTSILRASWPDSGVTFRKVWGAYQGGTGINQIAPANAGTFVTLGLYRATFAGTTVPGLVAVIGVQTIMFAFFWLITLIILLFYRPDTVDQQTGFLDSIGDWLSAHAVFTFLLVVGGGFLIALAVRVFLPKLKEMWRDLLEGAAILRTPGRYLRRVAFPQTVGYCFRIVGTATMMAAFDIPVNVHTVFLIVASHSISGMVTVTPGGVGTTQALDVLALQDYVSASVATAYSLAQDAVFSAWNIVLGIFAMCLGFGWEQTKQVMKDRGKIAEQVKAEEEAAKAAKAEEAAAGTAKDTAEGAPGPAT